MQESVLAITRLRSSDDLAPALAPLLDLLRAAPGCVRVDLARNVDDPGLWVLAGRWRDVGSWRRALASYDVKLAWLPLMPLVVDEPGTYELPAGTNETDAWNRIRPR